MNVKLIRIIDKYFFSIFCLIIGLFSLLFPKKLKTRKILIIKLWALGDSVLTLPMVNALKSKFKNSQIDILCHKSNKEVYLGNKNINNIIEINLKNVLGLFKKYDLCFDTEPYLNISALICWWVSSYSVGFSKQIRSILYQKKIDFAEQSMAENYLDMARIVGAKQNIKESTSLDYSKEDKIFVDKIFKKNKISKNDFIIGLSVGVGKSAKSRMWPLERFSEFADKLVEKKKAKIIFIDSKENKIYANKVKSMMKHKSFDFNGIFTIKHLFYLFKNVDIFITNDSGLMHLATNQGTKTIGLMGPSNPNWWKPYGKNGILIYHGKEVCPYAPCIISNKGIIPECRFGKNNKCMKAITVEEVYKKI